MRWMLTLTLMMVVTAPGAARERDLEDWVARDLVPYVNGQLSSLPMFRNESFRFVAMQDGNPASEATALALRIRDSLRDAARDVPGIRIAWQTGAPGLDPTDRRGIPDCTKFDANFLVGIEIDEVRPGVVEIQVRALDTQDREWVAGFGQSWRGQVTGRQRVEIRQTVSDPSFRGERDAPWQSFQTDLMAAQLAYDLGCALLRQTNGEYVVAANDTGDEADPTTALVELVGNNLAGMRALKFAPGNSNAIIEGKAHRIDEDLFQYWVTITPTDAGGEMGTLSADAYVRIEDTFQAATLLPEASATLASGGDQVLADFEVRRLQAGSACSAARPWQAGISSDRRGSAACFALQAAASEDAFVFFLNHQRNVGLVRLTDPGCTNRPAARIVRAHGTVRHTLPAETIGSGEWSASDRWSVSPQADTYYIVAVTDSRAARALTIHVGKLPVRCSASVRPGLEGATLRRWLDELEAISARWPETVEWRSLRVKDVY